MIQNYDATSGPVPIASPGATMAVDWEQRVDYARLRNDRSQKVRAALEASDLGALLLFDMNNVRYTTATHIGNWARDKLFRCVLVVRGHDPILWDIGSAARTHQMFAPLARPRPLAGRDLELARVDRGGRRCRARQRQAGGRHPP